ncbi:NUDIX domain-containing protein [Planococcus lenghuensis]|uniref:Nudix hydrolase domain-containing protein n=1 Tax=Planococcus lenghuensis TaxID=2213202 RepID=A0A1Q2KZ36_9BACL|nr:NUDIX domain-containing protein [Planococcus lenghuensis]AQQ53470.1 hypothetical protein B0X71_10555 [Planococcus lenghuensis]
MTAARKKWRGAAAIIVLENKMLMVKEKETGGWSIPSGGIEEGEFPEHAYIRKVLEETGFKVEIEKTLHSELPST